MKYECVRKSPGYKHTIWWGREGQFTIYFKYKWPFIKIYFFKSTKILSFE